MNSEQEHQEGNFGLLVSSISCIFLHAFAIFHLSQEM